MSMFVFYLPKMQIRTIEFMSMMHLRISVNIDKCRFKKNSQIV